MFASAYIISNGSGGPAGMTNFYTLYLYKRGFADLQMGYASAMAWVLVIAVGDHRLHPVQDPEVLGALRRREPMSTLFDSPSRRGRRERRSSPDTQPRRRVKRKTVNTIIWFVVLLALVAIVLYPLRVAVPLHVQAVERVRGRTSA